MKNNTLFLFMLAILACPHSSCTHSQASSAPAPCAFPGAEGFGRYATGGRGGNVYHVTTLEDGDQAGTFRHAVSQQGPRTVVFDVAGTIFLNRNLNISNGDLTIAGQTAPDQGICIARYPVSIKAENVIVRYMRFRVGNEGQGEPDGFGGTENKNIIIDHCSISWSVDEACTFYGGENVTVQWCLISESLRMAGHSKGAHGYGAIVGGHRSSFHHNLMAHHESRVPRLGPRPSTQEREYVDMRNNVFYNWAGAGCYGGEGMKVNIVNNYYKPGPATPKNSPVGYRIAAIGIRTTTYCTGRDGKPNVWKPMEHVWGRFYVDGNVMEGNDEVTKDNWTKGIYEQIKPSANDNTFTQQVKKDIRLSTPLETDVVTTHTAQEAYQLVLADAGCSLRRDIVDARIVEETRNGTATYQGSISADAKEKPGFIDVPTDVKPANAPSPWPQLSNGTASPTDSDGDGMPDQWETTHGLDPNNPADGRATTLCKEGYTNLEVYLNSLPTPTTAGTTCMVLSNYIETPADDVVRKGNPTVVDSPYGKAVAFDGKNDAIFLNRMPLTGLDQFTIEAIFKPQSGGAFEQRFFHCGEIGGDRILFELRATETHWYFDAYARSGSNDKALIDPELTHPLDEWYHAAFVIDKGHLTTYINGKKELEHTIDFSPIMTGRTSLGVRMNEVSWFKGTIRQFLVTPKVLAPQAFSFR